MGKLKGSLEFNFKPSMAYTQTANLFEFGLVELRAKALLKYLPHMAAQTMLEAVKAKIPNSAQYATYRNALRVVQSGNPSNPEYSIYGMLPKQKAAQEMDLLLFKLVRKRRKTPPEVSVLLTYQPWTQDTLPFDPDPKYVKTFLRKVSKREALAVRKARLADKPRWQKELTQAGVQAIPRKLDTPVNGVEDLAYTALRLEYGLGGTQPSAHWRPALKTVEQRVKQLTKSDTLVRALLDWRNKEWRSWLDITEPVVPTSKLDGARAFEDKIS